MTIAPGKNPSACPGAETLAAYLDGRLGSAERTTVSEHLAECEACYEVFTDSARFRLEEEAAGEGDGEVVAHRPATPVRRFAWVAALAAASLAAVVLWTPLFDRSGSGGQVAARWARGLEGEPFDASEWSVVRSGGGWAAGLSERQRSFRAGVRSVDLVVALDSGRTESARTILPELTDYAGSFELSEAIVAQLEAVEERLRAPGGPEAPLELATEAVDWLAEAADSEWFEFGAWAESGRLAASAGDARRLRSSEYRRMAERISAAELSPVAEALERARAGLEAGVDGAELDELADAFTEIATRAANPGG